MNPTIITAIASVASVIILLVTAILLLIQISEIRRATYASAFKAVYDILQDETKREDRGFVLVDVRSRVAFDQGHLPGAIHIPQGELTRDRLTEFGEDTLFVVYCAGPHCNGSTRGAIRIARIGRPVKEMIGGTTGWVDEGFSLVTK